MVAAVVLGIAFGGVRVLTKRFFPGKVFDRPEQIEVLQLGISGKKIDPARRGGPAGERTSGGALTV